MSDGYRKSENRRTFLYHEEWQRFIEITLSKRRLSEQSFQASSTK